ncbi:uncharacterized protein LOC119093760 isoform X2 [Pollicipes pollicipes]|uniref:uncharacterized protein LOC119093760 isoform X2 n=1 Tax=Pollicipes pollicipes TaxID=41117 RepID=UPI001885574D|nr:uncharacterized protein LOC119093760 isoform X2 [Pollicipes pollicipes]
MGCNASKDGVITAPAGVGKHSNGLDGNINQRMEELVDDPELSAAATKIQATFRGHQARRQQASQKMASLDQDIDLSDPELSAAATKIQATFRGHRVRKDDVIQKREQELNEQMEKLHTDTPKEEEIDIDLNDPEVMKAASKIQASFRAQFGKKK